MQVPRKVRRHVANPRTQPGDDMTPFQRNLVRAMEDTIPSVHSTHPPALDGDDLLFLGITHTFKKLSDRGKATEDHEL